MNRHYFHGKHGTQQRIFVNKANWRRDRNDRNSIRPFTKEIELDRPEQAKGVKVTYTTDPVEGEAWLRNNVLAVDHEVALGFDMEWKPQFIKKKLGGKEHKTAVLQLSTETSCLVLHIIHMKIFPRSLVNILSNKNILKVGCGIRSDISKLLKDTGLTCKSAVDLVHVANKVGYGKEHGLGLKSLSKNILGMEIEKPKPVQLSNWEQLPLQRNQIHYASLDAWVGIKLYLHMKQNDEVDCEILPAPQLFDLQQCICDVCGKKCKGTIELKEHLSHAGHTKCTQCGKVFVSKVSKKHLRQCSLNMQLLPNVDVREQSSV